MKKSDRKYLDKVASLGCILTILEIPHQCCGRITIHHCKTYLGGGRDHKKVIPLCWNMHLGSEGIDGKKMGKRVWEQKYGTEEMLMEKTNSLLEEK